MWVPYRKNAKFSAFQAHSRKKLQNRQNSRDLYKIGIKMFILQYFFETGTKSKNKKTKQKMILMIPRYLRFVS